MDHLVKGEEYLIFSNFYGKYCQNDLFLLTPSTKLCIIKMSPLLYACLINGYHEDEYLISILKKLTTVFNIKEVTSLLISILN